MISLKNSIRHFWIGLAAGFFGGILYHSIAWFAAWQWALGWSLAFLLGTIGLEFWQFLHFNGTWEEYHRYKLTDSIQDIIVGNVAFMLPLWVLSCGVYMGNVLR